MQQTKVRQTRFKYALIQVKQMHGTWHFAHRTWQICKPASAASASSTPCSTPKDYTIWHRGLAFVCRIQEIERLKTSRS